MVAEKLHFEHLKIAVMYIFQVSQPDEIQYLGKRSKRHHHRLKIVKTIPRITSTKEAF